MSGRVEAVDQTQSLYRRWHRSLVLTARNIVRDPAVAEEIAQDGWVRWLGAGHVDNAPGFLRRVVTNAAIDWIRSAKSEHLRLEASSLATGASLDTEQIIISRNIVVEVDRALDELDPKYRRVFQMRCIDGQTYDEIGRSLGVSGPRAHQIFRKAYLAIVDRIADTDREE